MISFTYLPRWLTLFGLSLLLLSGTACRKVEDVFTEKLPEATQQGEGTFGCLVDNKLWLPFVEHTLDSKIEVDYYPLAYSFQVQAENEKPNATSLITLYVQGAGLIKPGTYTLGNGFSASCTRDGRYQTPATGPGSITITKVEPQVVTKLGITTHYDIISGTFGFTAVNTATGKTMTITDGRFDVRGTY
jgi:hypothetical protein